MTNQTGDGEIGYFSQEMLDFLLTILDEVFINSGLIWWVGGFYLIWFIVLWRERRRKKREKIYRQIPVKHK